MSPGRSWKAQSDRKRSRDRPSRQLDRLRAELRSAELQLRVVGKQDEPGEPPELVREREALRRRRIALMLQIDEMIAAMAVAVPAKGKRTRQGPKGGVRSVAQGGSPGQGKRA